MSKGGPLISKSKYVAGLQCQKLLWFHFNAKDQLSAPGSGAQQRFDQGHEVGELAKTLFPGGIELWIGKEKFQESFTRTAEALKLRKPLFEPAIRHSNAFAYIDILNPIDKNQWDIIEVKSGGEVKDVHLDDLSLQLHVCRGAGLRIRKCILMHVNKQYVRMGAVDAGKFFDKEDVTDEVLTRESGIAIKLKNMTRIIALNKNPDVQIGSHCSSPYTCPLHDHCWDFVPDGSVFDLYRGGAKTMQLFSKGILKLTDIPDDFALTDKQTIQKQIALSGKPHINKGEIQKFLKSLAYPLHFLDFETFATAIPMFDRLKPNQHVPFQFSLHILNQADAKPQHHSYLADGREDPRPEFLAHLRDLLGAEGSIVVYNESFERGVLERCCQAFPEYRSWLKKILPRFVDLLVPFRNFYYHHPDQCGSASIKDVMPPLLGRGYDDLEIQEGSSASVEYLRVTFGDVEKKEKLKVRAGLEKYCERDTEGMVWIVEKLRELAKID